MRYVVFLWGLAGLLLMGGMGQASAQFMTAPESRQVAGNPFYDSDEQWPEFQGDLGSPPRQDPVANMQLADSARFLTGPDPQVQGPYESDLPIEPQPEQDSKEDAVSNEPVDLQADHIEHDEATETVIASGNVMLVQAGRIFRADQIAYDLKNDRVVASGHVVLNEANGDIHYADEVELKDEFKDGFVRELRTTLADGSRFSAADGTREDGILTIMNDATYTPCDPCKANPEKAPVWQLRASEVQHDNEEHTISYKNARFEALGVPLLYTPYFSHPDGTIKRKSGFLAPSGGYRSNIGAFIQSDYYWNIAPDKDATIGVMGMTKQAPMLLAEYRQRWQDAAFEMRGGITQSDFTDSVNGVNVEENDEVRGHVQGEGLWNMNEKWRSGVKIDWASDDQYMRQYDFSDEDVLENEIYAERFSGRNYAVGRLLTFQDVRVREEQEEQPEVMPEIIANFIGEPGDMPLVGGRWDANASFLGLRRYDGGQDMNRLSLQGGWQRRLVSDYGFLTTVDAGARGDFYAVTDRDVATGGSGRSRDSFAMQFFPQIHAQTSYPLVSERENYQLTLEPMAALTVAPNVDVNTRIPNEDSRDVQIDASNLFEPNRFPGLDRVEDRSRLTYGVRTGVYTYNGNLTDVFLGQSYRLSEKDNPFPAGSGLNDQNSDIVGQISSTIGNRYNLNYRFQLDNKTFSPQRHEVDASGRWNNITVGTRYLYASGLEDSGIDEDREQLQTALGYYLSKEWHVRGGATHDFGDENSGLRKAYAGVDFFGQCWSWSLIGQKNYTDDASGESDTEILFSLGLKNLGGFMESGYVDPNFKRTTER